MAVPNKFVFPKSLSIHPSGAIAERWPTRNIQKPLYARAQRGVEHVAKVSLPEIKTALYIYTNAE